MSDDIRSRLQQVEARCARLRVLFMIACICMVSLPLLTQLGNGHWPLPLAQAQPVNAQKDQTRTLTVSSIVIVDKNGRERCHLGTRDDGGCGLTIHDGRGWPAISLESLGGKPTFEINGTNGVRRIWAWADDDKAGISIQDPNDEDNGVDIINLAKGASAITIKGPDDRRIFLQVPPTGSPRFEIYGKGNELLFQPRVRR
jgi:hypothetical protein